MVSETCRPPTLGRYLTLLTDSEVLSEQPLLVRVKYASKFADQKWPLTIVRHCSEVVTRIAIDQFIIGIDAGKYRLLFNDDFDC